MWPVEGWYSVVISNKAAKPTGRHSQSGSPTPPGVWKIEKNASLEVLGCKLSSFPASEANINIFYKKAILSL